MANYLLRIKGFSPESLPLNRLGEYLLALADLVGDAPVHFDKVTKGSAKLKLKIEDSATSIVESRVRLAPSSAPGSTPRNAYDRLQKLLREDQTSAEFRPEKGAVILQFPGARTARSAQSVTVRDQGELHGRIIRLGGKDTTVPVGLQTPEGHVIPCTATVEQARELKAYLLEPIDVVLCGVGRWSRTEDGVWEVADFKINTFAPFRLDDFDAALAKVKRGGSGWDSEPDLDAALHRIRYGE